MLAGADRSRAPRCPRNGRYGSCLLHGVRPRFTIGVGLALIGASTLAQAVLGAGSSWPALIPGLPLAGIGTVLTSRMAESLGDGRSHALAGGDMPEAVRAG